jgi:predicted esterase
MNRMLLEERHLPVERRARFYLDGTPGHTTTELWVACHGYGQLAATFGMALAPLSRPGRLIAVPEALSRFYLDDPGKRHGPNSSVGASWMTREDRTTEIADYVDYLDRLASSLVDQTKDASPRVTALGFSQGAATACRWAALGRTKVDRLIVWGGTLPLDLPDARGDLLFRGAWVVLVGGRQDKLATPEALEHDRATLERRGIRAEVVWHDGGHTLSSATLAQLGAQ